MGKDRKHLKKKQTTDKNGKETTVYVKGQAPEAIPREQVLRDLKPWLPQNPGVSASAGTADMTEKEFDEARERILSDIVADNTEGLDEKLDNSVPPRDDLDDDTINSVLVDPTNSGLSGHYRSDGSEDEYPNQEARSVVTDQLIRDDLDERISYYTSDDCEEEERLPNDFSLSGEENDESINNSSHDLLSRYDDSAYIKGSLDNAAPRGFEYDMGRYDDNSHEDDAEVFASEILPDDATEEEKGKTTETINNLVNGPLSGRGTRKLDLVWNGKPSELIDENGAKETPTISNENERAQIRMTDAGGNYHYASLPSSRAEVNHTANRGTSSILVSDDFMVGTYDSEE